MSPSSINSSNSNDVFRPIIFMNWGLNYGQIGNDLIATKYGVRPSFTIIASAMVNNILASKFLVES